MMDIKVLVCDDDPVFRDLVCDIVKKEGYIPVEAEDGQQALDIFFASEDIDLVILDVMMPGLDGWETLKEIRDYSDIPVIMLTALGDERHEITGLKKGADEYISKPFSYMIFVARMNALLRKRKKDLLQTIIAGELIIEGMSHRVLVSGKEAHLSHKEYELLSYLYKNKNRIVTREQIICSVWGYDYEKDIRTVDTHIKTLRAKLGHCCGGYIKTARGTGYIFEVE